MEWVIGKTIGALLVPPGILLIALLGSLALTWRRPSLARGLLLLSVIALYALSTQFVADQLLLRMLEPEARDPTSDRSGQAIVVLGGGIDFDAPEYGGDTVNGATLVRLRYAAHLYRALQRPVLTSGGSHKGSPTPEARAMKQVLQHEFQVPVQWSDEASSNTLENARATFNLLNAAGIRRIYLVTHAWHMARAQFAFQSTGITVIPAPTAYASRTLSLLYFLPNGRALFHSGLFFHETIGLGWYHLKIAIGR